MLMLMRRKGKMGRIKHSGLIVAGVHVYADLWNEWRKMTDG